MNDDVGLPNLEWICTGHHCWRAGRIAHVLHHHLRAPIPTDRISRDAWTRYRLELVNGAELHEAPKVHRFDNSLFRLVSRHREAESNQVRSALRFWRLGLGQGYLWMEDDEPLCLQWLFTAEDLLARKEFGTWAGMYPPVGKRIGIVEAIYAFRKGMRRPGGVGTPMARAVLREARKNGLTELRTQVHQSNTAAHRWAARVGWQPFGEALRYSLDLRGARGHHLYLHTRGERKEINRKER